MNTMMSGIVANRCGKHVLTLIHIVDTLHDVKVPYFSLDDLNCWCLLYDSM